MRVVILYKSGKPVKLNNQFSEEDLLFTIEGFLISFSFLEGNKKKKYRFYDKSDFKEKYQIELDGYYDEDAYLKYYANVGPNIPSLNDLLKEYKFNFQKFIASKGDEVFVNRTNFDTPFEDFYRRDKYTFTIENTVDNSGVRNYIETIYNNSSVDYKVRIPEGIVPISIQVLQSETAGGYFYKKNLGDFINQSIISIEDKRWLKKIMTITVFKIRSIVNDVFPYMLSDFQVVDNFANSSDQNINISNPLYELLFLLKKSWGYYYGSNYLNDSTFPHRNSFPEILNNQSTYNDFLNYYNGLTSFYYKSYRVLYKISSWPDSMKYEHLLEVLPPSALSILPLAIIKKIINDFLKRGKIAEYEEQFVVRLILAVLPANSNEFLEYLLVKPNGSQTNFELIYAILDDARVERYSIANWIADEQTNRKVFVFAIYQLWKESKFNFYELTAGITPLSGNVNPNSYFLQNPNEFNEKNILVFKTTTSYQSGGTPVFQSEGGLLNSKQDYSISLKDNLIKIFRRETNTFYPKEANDDGYGAPAIGGLTVIKSIPLGGFHIFHPISVIGYQSDPEIVMPQTSFIPAFLLYYADDFDKLKDFDAGVNLAIEISTEIALLFLTEGVSLLSHLNHLKHTYKIFKAMQGALPATEAILVWRGLEVGSSTLAVTASIFNSFNDYINNTSNDIEKKQWLSNVFLLIILACATSSIIFRYKAVKAADELLNKLPSGTLPPDVEDLLIYLKGQKASNILSFGSKMQEKGFLNALNKYNGLSIEAKEAFIIDFGNKLDDAVLWNKLNELDGIAVNQWELLFNKNIVDRRFIDVITSPSRVEKIIKYYNEASLKNILEPLTAKQRWQFLDNIGNLTPTNFQKFVSQPNLVKTWLRYDDLTLRPVFRSLNESSMMKIIEEFGDLSDDLFKALKRNPSKLSEYANLSTASRKILRDNIYFWLKHKLDFGQVQRIEPYLNNAYNKILRDKGSNAFAWFTNPLNKSNVINYLKSGSNWENGKVFEIMAESHIKKAFLNSNTDVITGVDIHLFNSNGVTIKKDILELDFIVINKNNNKIDNIGSVKISKGFDAEFDIKKLNPLYKDLPNSLEQIKTYLTDVLNVRIRNNGIQNVAEIKIVGKNLRNNIEFIESIIEFKQRIKPINEYNKNINFKKVNVESLKIRPEDIQESAYYTIINKF